MDINELGNSANRSRTSRLLGKKLNKPLFLIHTISSLDDAIDFSNKGYVPHPSLSNPWSDHLLEKTPS